MSASTFSPARTVAGGAPLLPGLRLGIYARISDDDRDPETGELTREGVDRQVKDCTRVIEDAGCYVARVYDDNDKSASDPHVTRDSFESLIQDLADGTIDGFLFYHADRVARQAFDASRVCQIYERNPTLTGFSITGGTDLSIDSGRAMFVMQAVMGGVEAASTRRRKRDSNRHKAEAGKRHVGRTAWGWNADGTLREPGATLLRKAILDVGYGVSVSEIRKEWRAAGITGSSGKPVTHATVKHRISNPRNAGFRIYSPAEDRKNKTNPWGPDIIMYNDSGKPVVGDWEPVCTPEEYWAAIAQMEKTREAAKRNGKSTPGRHSRLLSGFLRCGECGHHMNVTARTVRGTKKAFYRCPPENSGCGNLTRTADPIEKHVELAVLAAVQKIAGQARPKIDSLNEKEAAAERRLAEIGREIPEIMARRKPGAEKKISTSLALDMVSELEQEKADLIQETKDIAAQRHIDSSNAGDVLKNWEYYTLARKRAEVAQFVRSIVVEKAGRGKRFDPVTIDIDWHPVFD